MTVEIIKQRLENYHCDTEAEKEQALREITQEIILMELSRHEFFTKAEFHGGTALRILYRLQRFSEDLDFALLKPDIAFSLTPYLRRVTDGLRAFGYDFEIQDRSGANAVVKKAFLKDDSLGKIFILKNVNAFKKIVIKLEVDTNPPLGATTEIKQLIFPAPFSITVKDLKSSFAGKLHALLCRPYVKGRDWFDFVWYVTQKTKINYVLLNNALHQIGSWQNTQDNINADWVISALRIKINNINWAHARRDVSPFIKALQRPSLELWSKDFFNHLVEEMKNYL